MEYTGDWRIVKLAANDCEMLTPPPKQLPCPLVCETLLCLVLIVPPGDRGGYIPYRDSKLTRLLQPSLGGNAKITIICTVTGALLSSDETHNTLKFANRAKRMKNHAAINEVSNEKVGCCLECSWTG